MRHFKRRLLFAGLLALGIYYGIKSCKSESNVEPAPFERTPERTVVVNNFKDSGEKTTGGYNLFDYSGSLEDRAAIADAFDAWNDEHKGVDCANVGTDNVRINGRKIRVAANCSNDLVTYEAPQAKPKQNPLPIEKDTPTYSRIDYNNPKLKEDIKNNKFEPYFLKALEEMCLDLKIHCMGLLSVIYHESKFDPKAQNLKTKATGLIQFLPSTAKYLRTSIDNLLGMSQIEQLNYVRAHFETFRRKANYKDPKEVAKAVFYPDCIGTSKCEVTREGSETYESNKSADTNGDGILLVDEYVQRALNHNYF